MPANDAHLYGVQRPKKLSGKEISSTSALAFTSELSSLISASKSTSRSAPLTGRSRPRSKEDIFTKHNKGSRKRALADLDDDNENGASGPRQKHSTSSEHVDDATWRRARRKMEEKARLYAAMKRGDVEDENERYAVDFDRKWAETEEGQADDDTSEGEEDNGSDDEVVEYEDEFGRMRKGTRVEAEREERRKMARERGEQDTDRFTARPSAPSNVIRGDTIQAEAFNPDAQIERAMEELAAKRDRSLTPPPDTHFDGRAEVRQKGQGFFQFSADEEERRRQMANLEKEREETAKRRQENDNRKDARRREVEERRKAIQAKRGKLQADKFLDGLASELSGTAEEGQRKSEQQVDLPDDAPAKEPTNAGSLLRDKISAFQDGDDVD